MKIDFTYSVENGKTQLKATFQKPRNTEVCSDGTAKFSAPDADLIGLSEDKEDIRVIAAKEALTAMLALLS